MSLEQQVLGLSPELLGFNRREVILGFPTFGTRRIQANDPGIQGYPDHFVPVDISGVGPIKIDGGKELIHPIAAIAARAIEQLPENIRRINTYGLSQGGTLSLWAAALAPYFGREVATSVSGHSPGVDPRNWLRLVTEQALEGRGIDQTAKKPLSESIWYSIKYSLRTLILDDRLLRRVRALANGIDEALILYLLYQNQCPDRFSEYYKNLKLHLIVGEKDRIGRQMGAYRITNTVIDTFNSDLEKKRIKMPGGTVIISHDATSVPFSLHIIRDGTHDYARHGADLATFTRRLFEERHKPLSGTMQSV